jgi:hypothetical protein
MVIAVPRAHRLWVQVIAIIQGNGDLRTLNNEVSRMAGPEGYKLIIQIGANNTSTAGEMVQRNVSRISVT